MSSYSVEDCKCPAAGTPAWVMTFADLMALLMCFFVLLLSFTTMDAVRFKKMADSFKDAFGVQREIPVYEIVKGTGVVAQHFSPATVDPIPVEEMLRVEQKNVEAEAETIRDSLKEEISKGLVSVETAHLKIIIRIHEKGSFPSGSAVLNASFEPVMDKMVKAVSGSSGDVVVAGHTDNIPFSTAWYRSNWELAAGRAVTVAHWLLSDGTIDPNRLVVEGHADTDPLGPNNSYVNRAKNRRVEIILIKRVSH